MPPRQLHLNVNLLHSGVYPSAWRLPDSDPRAFFDLAHHVRVAQIAERGKFDAIFLARSIGQYEISGTPLPAKGSF